MDKQARGALLVEKEDAEARIKSLRDNLARAGRTLAMLGRHLQGKPEDVTFSNAPGDLGQMPPHLINSQYSTQWEDIPNREQVAQRIQDLRREIRNLEGIQQQLQTK